MPKFVIDTERQSIFEPIEFEINGKTYRVKEPINNLLIREAKKYEDAAIEGDSEALFKQFSLLTGVDLETVSKIDIRVINDALRFFVQAIQYPVKTEDGKKKQKSDGDNKPEK
jgi:hypothetical protein